MSGINPDRIDELENTVADLKEHVLETSLKHRNLASMFKAHMDMQNEIAGYSAKVNELQSTVTMLSTQVQDMSHKVTALMAMRGTGPTVSE